MFGEIYASQLTEKDKILAAEELRAKWIELSKTSTDTALSLRELGGFAEKLSYGRAKQLHGEGKLRNQGIRQAGEIYRRGKIDRGEGLGGTDMWENAQDQMRYDSKDMYDDVLTSQTQMLNQFRTGVSEVIKGAKDMKSAFSEVFQAIADTALKSTLDMAINGLMNALFVGLPKTFHQGGMVDGFARGGMVRGGSGTKDDVPAMLQKGEFVVRKSSVRKYGSPFFQGLNKGGEVGRGTMPQPRSDSDIAAENGGISARKTRPSKRKRLDVQRFADGGIVAEASGWGLAGR
jgi:hypothetical protein